MSSNFSVKDRMYDPTKRFAFTNITDKPFTFTWDSRPITVEIGETVELPEYLAVLATAKIVDEIMTAEIKAEEDIIKKDTRDPYYRSPRANSLAVPAARKPYEDKVVKELAPHKNNDARMQVIRASLTDEIKKDLNAKPASAISGIGDLGFKSAEQGLKEFADISVTPKS